MCCGAGEASDRPRDRSLAPLILRVLATERAAAAGIPLSPEADPTHADGIWENGTAGDDMRSRALRCQTDCAMQCRTLFSVVILTGTIALGCRPHDSPPAPPVPPDLTGRATPKPRGSDDYARRSFATPLSVPDAEAILGQTRVFEFGGMPPKRQVQAFNVLFEQRDAALRFRRLAETASPAGKLYALAGLLVLDRPAAGRLRRTLAEESQTIVVCDSDVVDEKPVSELADIVERREMGPEFRRMRDETNAYYAKLPRTSRSTTP